MDNPFKQLELEASCPPEVRKAIIAELDIIRNSLSIVELYTHDLFNTLGGLLTSPDNTDVPT